MRERMGDFSDLVYEFGLFLSHTKQPKFPVQVIRNYKDLPVGHRWELCQSPGGHLTLASGIICLT
jgi:hypothetical protein